MRIENAVQNIEWAYSSGRLRTAAHVRWGKATLAQREKLAARALAAQPNPECISAYSVAMAYDELAEGRKRNVVC
jgi:hypothetical protein